MKQYDLDGRYSNLIGMLQPHRIYLGVNHPRKFQVATMLVEVALVLTVLGWSGSPTKLQAHPVSPEMLANTPTERSLPINLSVQFKPPNDGAPGPRKGGGTRPGCPAVNQPLTALVPTTNLGWTTAAHPTFWVYIPYQVTSSRPVEFILRDANQNQIYKSTFQFTGQPGIANFPLPETVSPLEVGKKYRWSVSFLCTNNRDEAPAVSGWVKRVTPSAAVVSQLEAATARERIVVYAENGWWYDTLTALAALRRTAPDASLDAAWADLLRHRGVRLDELVSQPLVRCCTSQD